MPVTVGTATSSFSVGSKPASSFSTGKSSSSSSSKSSSSSSSSSKSSSSSASSSIKTTSMKASSSAVASAASASAKAVSSSAAKNITSTSSSTLKAVTTVTNSASTTIAATTAKTGSAVSTATTKASTLKASTPSSFTSTSSVQTAKVTQPSTTLTAVKTGATMVSVPAEQTAANLISTISPTTLAKIQSGIESTIDTNQNISNSAISKITSSVDAANSQISSIATNAVNTIKTDAVKAIQNVSTPEDIASVIKSANDSINEIEINASITKNANLKAATDGIKTVVDTHTITSTALANSLDQPASLVAVTSWDTTTLKPATSSAATPLSALLTQGSISYTPSAVDKYSLESLAVATKKSSLSDLLSSVKVSSVDIDKAMNIGSTTQSADFGSFAPKISAAEQSKIESVNPVKKSDSKSSDSKSSDNNLVTKKEKVTETKTSSKETTSSSEGLVKKIGTIPKDWNPVDHGGVSESLAKELTDAGWAENPITGTWEEPGAVKTASVNKNFLSSSNQVANVQTPSTGLKASVGDSFFTGSVKSTDIATLQQKAATTGAIVSDKFKTITAETANIKESVVGVPTLLLSVMGTNVGIKSKSGKKLDVNPNQYYTAKIDGKEQVVLGQDLISKYDGKVESVTEKKWTLPKGPIASISEAAFGGVGYTTEAKLLHNGWLEYTGEIDRSKMGYDVFSAVGATSTVLFSGIGSLLGQGEEIPYEIAYYGLKQPGASGKQFLTTITQTLQKPGTLPSKAVSSQGGMSKGEQLGYLVTFGDLEAINQNNPMAIAEMAQNPGLRMQMVDKLGESTVKAAETKYGSQVSATKTEFVGDFVTWAANEYLIAGGTSFAGPATALITIPGTIAKGATKITTGLLAKESERLAVTTGKDLGKTIYKVSDKSGEILKVSKGDILNGIKVIDEKTAIEAADKSKILSGEIITTTKTPEAGTPALGSRTKITTVADASTVSEAASAKMQAATLEGTKTITKSSEKVISTVSDHLGNKFEIVEDLGNGYFRTNDGRYVKPSTIADPSNPSKQIDTITQVPEIAAKRQIVDLSPDKDGSILEETIPSRQIEYIDSTGVKRTITTTPNKVYTIQYWGKTVDNAGNLVDNTADLRTIVTDKPITSMEDVNTAILSHDSDTASKVMASSEQAYTGEGVMESPAEMQQRLMDEQGGSSGAGGSSGGSSGGVPSGDSGTTSLETTPTLTDINGKQMWVWSDKDGVLQIKDPVSGESQAYSAYLTKLEEEAKGAEWAEVKIENGLTTRTSNDGKTTQVFDPIDQTWKTSSQYTQDLTVRSNTANWSTQTIGDKNVRVGYNANNELMVLDPDTGTQVKFDTYVANVKAAAEAKAAEEAAAALKQQEELLAKYKAAQEAASSTSSTSYVPTSYSSYLPTTSDIATTSARDYMGLDANGIYQALKDEDFVKYAYENFTSKDIAQLEKNIRATEGISQSTADTLVAALKEAYASGKMPTNLDAALSGVDATKMTDAQFGEWVVGNIDTVKGLTDDQISMFGLTPQKESILQGKRTSALLDEFTSTDDFGKLSSKEEESVWNALEWHAGSGNYNTASKNLFSTVYGKLSSAAKTLYGKISGAVERIRDLLDEIVEAGDTKFPASDLWTTGNRNLDDILMARVSSFDSGYIKNFKTQAAADAAKAIEPLISSILNKSEIYSLGQFMKGTKLYLIKTTSSGSEITELKNLSTAIQKIKARSGLWEEVIKIREMEWRQPKRPAANSNLANPNQFVVNGYPKDDLILEVQPDGTIKDVSTGETLDFGGVDKVETTVTETAPVVEAPKVSVVENKTYQEQIKELGEQQVNDFKASPAYQALKANEKSIIDSAFDYHRGKAGSNPEAEAAARKLVEEWPIGSSAKEEYFTITGNLHYGYLGEPGGDWFVKTLRSAVNGDMENARQFGKFFTESNANTVIKYYAEYTNAADMLRVMTPDVLHGTGMDEKIVDALLAKNTERAGRELQAVAELDPYKPTLFKLNAGDSVTLEEMAQLSQYAINADPNIVKLMNDYSGWKYSDIIGPRNNAVIGSVYDFNYILRHDSTRLPEYLQKPGFRAYLGKMPPEQARFFSDKMRAALPDIEAAGITKSEWESTIDDFWQAVRNKTDAPETAYEEAVKIQHQLEEVSGACKANACPAGQTSSTVQAGLNQQKSNVQNTINAVDDQIRSRDELINKLKSDPELSDVRKKKEYIENAIASNEGFRNYVRNASRDEAEKLANEVFDATGSDRVSKEKILGLFYNGWADGIKSDSALLNKLSKSDRDLIRRSAGGFDQKEVAQFNRIMDSIPEYRATSISEELGQIKINSILDSDIPDKTAQLRKLLSDTDVRNAVRASESTADEIVGRLGTEDVQLASEFQKIYQNKAIEDMMNDPKFKNLNQDQQQLVKSLYTKKTLTADDIENLATIKKVMPHPKYQQWVRGSAVGVGSWLRTNPGKAVLGGWALINLGGFAYFAVEEGFQSMVQMVGWNQPEDKLADYFQGTALPGFDAAWQHLGFWNWVLDNSGMFGKIMLPGPSAFKWYLETAAVGQLKDKLSSLEQAGVWVMPTTCEFGPGCWGQARSEEDRLDYWAKHPETVAMMKGDLIRRFYDIQADGSVGPNNFIAKALGITDPNLAIQIGQGHMQAAANQGAKDNLTKEFSAAYDQIVKGGVKSEVALQAYNNALTTQGTTPGSTPVMKLDSNAGASAASSSVYVRAAPTAMDAYAKYASYGGTGTNEDKAAFMALFQDENGALDLDTLKATYPDMTGDMITDIFGKGSVLKGVQSEMAKALAEDPTGALAAKRFGELKSEGLVDPQARFETYLPPETATAVLAYNNNPFNHNYTVSGDTISWVDSTNYPHNENLVKNSKVLDPRTGDYSIDLKRKTEDGSEYTIDTGKYAEFLRSGGKDVEAFLKDEGNWIQTWKGTGSSKSSGKGGGGGGGRGGSGSSSSGGQTGVLINSNNLQADVYENGEIIGKTDAVIEVEAGLHTFLVKKEGYREATTAIQIPEGRVYTTNVYLSLLPSGSSNSGNNTDTTTEAPSSGTVDATVVDVTDGDTIKVETDNISYSVRLYGVSASGAEYDTGAQAKAWLEYILPEGTEVSIDIRGVDPYSRREGVVYLDGVNVNEAIIAAGLARNWTASEKQQCILTASSSAANVPCGNNLKWTGNKTVPAGIVPGGKTWIGVELQNLASTSGRYWIGVQLYNSSGQMIYENRGNSQYASVIAAGEKKTLWLQFTAPTSLPTGITHVDVVVNSV